MLTGQLTPSPSLADQKAILLEHYRAIRAHFGEGPGVRLGRKHVAWYSHGLHGSAAFRAQMNRLDNGAAVEQLIHDFYDPLIGAGLPCAKTKWRSPHDGGQTSFGMLKRSAAPAQTIALDPAQILGALPLAVAVLDERQFRLRELRGRGVFRPPGPAAQFPLSDILPADHPIFLVLERARQDGQTIAEHDMILEGPRMTRRGCSVQGRPAAGTSGLRGADPAGRIGRPRARPADVRPQRGAQHHRHGGDFGA